MNAMIASLKLKYEPYGVIAVVPYGSRVYGTCSPSSDHDFLVVTTCAADPSNVEGIDTTVVTLEEYEKVISVCDAKFLEILWTPQQLVDDDSFCFLTQQREKFEQLLIDRRKETLGLMRIQFSKLSGNSNVKARKKIQDGEHYIGAKSMFHSIRLLRFAIQIAEHGAVVNFAEANHVWYLLKDHLERKELSEQMLRNFYKEHVKTADASGLHLMSRFKQLLPKGSATAGVQPSQRPPSATIVGLPNDALCIIFSHCGNLLEIALSCRRFSIALRSNKNARVRMRSLLAWMPFPDPVDLMIPSKCLKVLHLPEECNEMDIFQLVQPVAPVASIRVVRDQISRNSLGYAYVNFFDTDAAIHARDMLHMTPLASGHMLQLIFKHDLALKNLFRRDVANLWFGDDDQWNIRSLVDTASMFGPILFATMSENQHGLVQFARRADALDALQVLLRNGFNVGGVVSKFFGSEDAPVIENPRWGASIPTEQEIVDATKEKRNLHVENVPLAWDAQKIADYFGGPSHVESVRLALDSQGYSLGYSYVMCHSADIANEKCVMNRSHGPCWAKLFLPKGQRIPTRGQNDPWSKH